MCVDVIIPLYNGGPWIQEAIESVIAQEMAPKQIVVIDDGSTDGSPDLVRNYSNVKLLSNTGRGSSIARNVGLLNTNSTYVAFLDQDDVWHPSHLKILFQALQRYPDVNTAFASASCFKESSPKYQLNLEQPCYFDPWTRFPFTMGIDGPSLALIRRQVIEQVGMWEEGGTGMGDVLLFLKLSALHPLMQISSCTVGKRIHANQQWLRVREQSLNYMDFRRRVTGIAFDFYKKLKQSEKKLNNYEKRLMSLEILRCITEVILMNKFEDVTELALQLERLLEKEHPELFPHVFYCLMGALFPTNDIEELRKKRDCVFSKLLEFWPDKSILTKSALAELIGETPRVS